MQQHDSTSEPGSITRLIVELLSDNKETRNQAAQQLYERMDSGIKREARRHLPSRVKRVVADSDVAQDVWISFFSLIAETQHDTEITDRNSLRKLLRQMVRNRCIDARRRELAKRRGGDQTLEAVDDDATGDRPQRQEKIARLYAAPHPIEEVSDSQMDSAGLKGYIGNLPYDVEPSAVLIIGEALDALPDDLRELAIHRAIEGRSYEELKEMFGWSRTTTSEKIRKIQSRWHRLFLAE